MRLFDLTFSLFLLLLITLAKSPHRSVGAAVVEPTGQSVLHRLDELFLDGGRTARPCFPFVHSAAAGRQSPAAQSAARSTDARDDAADRFSSRRRSHDLTKCPANAADPLVDLADVDPPTNLSALRNRTDSTTINHTNVEQPIDPTAACAGVDERSGELPVGSADEPKRQVDGEVRASDDGAIPLKPPAETPPASTPEPPPPIATFEEWTKEKLMNKEKRPPPKEFPAGTPQETNGAAVGGGTAASAGAHVEQGGVGSQPNGHSNPQVAQSPQSVDQKPPLERPPLVIAPAELPKRNYASRECGAKVLLANEEAEHRNAVLNDKERDEYMRNPCEKAKNKFLVIELCETIQPTLLELANFELFSSGPRDFALSVSERYPTLEWTPVGQFVAEDTREPQTFSFASPGIYAKFIRLDLLTHYGREHYCTLSTIRVSGISMVDEYEAEASSMDNPSANVIPPEVVVPQPTAAESVPPPHTPPVVPPPVETPPTATPLDAPHEPKAADPTNESGTADPKVRVLHKVVNIVENLSSIKEVIGKTLLGSQWKRTNAIIHPAACSNHSPLDPELALHRSSSRCHYFGVLELPLGFARRRSPVQWATRAEASANRTGGQAAFLRAIEKLRQCPTAAAAPKIVEIVESTPPPTETILPEPPLVIEVEKKAEEPKAATPLPVQQTVPPTPQQQQQQPPQPNGHYTAPKAPSINSLPGTASTHKESVFMKLNKRLSALELNMSLSSEYLSELSRRYVAQQDGYNKQHERDVRTLELMVEKLGQQMKAVWSEEIRSLRREMNDLARQMQFLKEGSRIPPHFNSPSTSSLSLFHRDDGRCVQCFNMLPPAAEDEDDEDFHDAPSGEGTFWSWTNDQLLAIIFLSNLSAFALFTVVFLLYKIVSKGAAVRDRPVLSPDEIRTLIEQEMERIRASAPSTAAPNGQPATSKRNGECNPKIRLSGNSICASS
ncbi:SUN domain-containing ossification factor [Aphelenchoides fujianensis]|nr:SUN domain-containing ossification factor [Aphelenchoides fujianensis]